MTQPDKTRVTHAELRAALATLQAQIQAELKPAVREAVRKRREQQTETMKREVLMRGLRNLFPR